MIERLGTFRASGHRFQNLMARRKITSMKPRCEEGFWDAEETAQHRLHLGKIIGFWNVVGIVNTD